MRKFLSPILNVINLILVSIAWGLSGQSAVKDAVVKSHPVSGNMYQVVWMGSKANIIGIIGFLLFCVACFGLLVAFLPLKVRKFVACLNGLMFAGAGVLLLLAPKFYCAGSGEFELTGAFIAICVLILVAALFSLCMAAVDFTAKKESK